jgi:hypothetical protein
MERDLENGTQRSVFALRILLPALLTLCVAAAPLAARAEVILAQDEAMEAAFGAGAQITSHTKKISSDQKIEIEELAQTKLTSLFLHYYEGRRNGEFLGYAVIDSRVMRTNLAVFMVVISKDLVVQKVILLAFHEPSDYQPTDSWLKLLEGPRPMEDLVPGQGLAPIAGSTLTVNGLSDGVRAVRASFEVLLKEGK